MKTIFGLGIVLTVATALAVDAQESRRPLSPAGSTATQIGGSVFDGRQGFVGGKWIDVTYGRPIRRGRDLFGLDDFAEFLNDGGPVWRAGANVTTQLTTETALSIGETEIPPGRYTLFIELARDEWILIVSTLEAQTIDFDEDSTDSVFGAYGYTPDRDVVRIAMHLEMLPYNHDQLHWEFLDVTPDGGRLAIFWENRMASVAFGVPE